MTPVGQIAMASGALILGNQNSLCLIRSSIAYILYKVG